MQAQTLRTFPASQLPQRRAMGAGLVITLHVALIYALLNGLGATIIDVIKHPERITLVNIPPPAPPPPVPQARVPVQPQVFVPAPQIPLPPQNGGNAVTPTTSDPPPAVPPQPARGVMTTHTIPDYPPISIRLGEVGTVSLRLAISDTGRVTDALVLHSSGHARLDIAAVAWVKAHWLYQPATQNGQPVASNAQAEVKFELH